jgi:hypothetical protein
MLMATTMAMAVGENKSPSQQQKPKSNSKTENRTEHTPWHLQKPPNDSFDNGKRSDSTWVMRHAGSHARSDFGHSTQ